MKKFFIALMCGTLLLLGVVLLVLPGPGLPVMAAGIAILATEFLWARHALRRARGAVAKAGRKNRLMFWFHRILRKCMSRDLHRTNAPLQQRSRGKANHRRG